MSVDVARALARQPTTDALWSVALLDLWSAHREPRTMDRVIGRLSEVYARDSSNALVLNDLALAYLARAADRDDARDLFSAVDFAERAFDRDSGSSVVRFNRAVILERAYLGGEAAAAWQTAAAAPDDGWAREAQERRLRLASSDRVPRIPAALMDSAGAIGAAALMSIARRDPQAAREYVLDTLVRRWARASLVGDSTTAAAAVTRAEVIGRTLLSASGDSSVVHVAAEMVLAGASAQMRQSVAGTVGEAATATSDYRQTRYVIAEPRLRAAVVSLRRLHVPMLADWTELLVAAIEVQRSSYAVAERRFGEIAARAKGRQAIALEARALWGMALSQARRGATSETERAYRVAVDDFERLGETSNVGFMQALVADIHHALGRSSEYARAMYAALDAFDRRDDPSLRYAVLLALGQRLADDGVQHAAVAAIREAVGIAPRTGRAKDIPESFERLAYEQARLGDMQRATANLALARSALSSITDSLMRARLDVEIARAEAVVYSESEPMRALDRLEHVARYFRGADIPTDYGPALTKRADLRLALGDSIGALADLDSATTVVRTLVSSSSNRETVRRLVVTQSHVYRRLVAIALARGDTGLAYRYSELSRATQLIPRGARASVRRSTPEGLVTLAYLFLPDRLLIWTVAARRPTASLVTVLTTPEQVGALVTRFVNLIREDTDAQAEAEVARRLYEVLIVPVEGALVSAHEVVLVPDGAIADVPFAALRDRRDRYLVEEFALAYAERVSDRSLVRLSARTVVGGQALLVGNPAWDRALFPDLDVLRSADSEVESIRSLYLNPRMLTGAAATRQALLRELPRHALVHFAGHARVVREAPSTSHLVMAHDTSGFVGNVVIASDLTRMDLSAVRLVILSACGEGRDRYAGSAKNGLVEALLDAGVGEVIASQWEADDAGTAKLMAALHKEFAAGAGGAEALRRAQIVFKREAANVRGGGTGSRIWGAFRYYVSSGQE